MKLSIVIPCYNEAKTIRTIVDRVRAAPVQDKDIIVVDDGSRDDTRDLLPMQITPLVATVSYHRIMRSIVIKAEITAMVVRLKVPIYEVGISYSGRHTPKARKSPVATASWPCGRSRSAISCGDGRPLQSSPRLAA